MKIIIPFGGRKPDHLMRAIAPHQDKDLVIGVKKGTVVPIFGDRTIEIVEVDTIGKNPIEICLKVAQIISDPVIIIMHDDILVSPEQLSEMAAATKKGVIVSGRVLASNAYGTSHWTNYRQDENTSAGHLWAFQREDFLKLDLPDSAFTALGGEGRFITTSATFKGMRVVYHQTEAYHMAHTRETNLPFESRFQKLQHDMWQKQMEMSKMSPPAPTPPPEMPTLESPAPEPTEEENSSLE